MAEVADRWFKLDKATGKRVRSAEYGRGKRWVARWRDPDGRQRVAGSYIDASAGKQSFREYTEAWLKIANHDPSTDRLYRRLLKLHIYPVLADKALGGVRHSHA